MLEEGRRVVVSEFAETPLEAIDGQTSLVAMPAPDPAKLGARDVLVAIKSAQVGWVDLLMTSGQYQHMPKPPYCPGLEYAGVVAWKGADASGVAVGDEVLVDAFVVGPRSLGDYQACGRFRVVRRRADRRGASSSRKAHARSGVLLARKLRDRVSLFDDARKAPSRRDRARARRVGIDGARSGARREARGREGDRRRTLEGQARHREGAGRRSRRQPRERRQHARRSEGHRERAASMSCTTASAVTFRSSAMRCVKFGARFLIVGWASTPFVAKGKGQRGAPNANMLPTNLMMMKSLDVLGCPTVISTVMNPSSRAPRLAKVLAWAESGAITPYVSRTFPLADYKAAMRAKWNGEIIGSCVLHP